MMRSIPAAVANVTSIILRWVSISGLSISKVLWIDMLPQGKISHHNCLLYYREKAFHKWLDDAWQRLDFYSFLTMRYETCEPCFMVFFITIFCREGLNLGQILWLPLLLRRYWNGHQGYPLIKEIVMIVVEWKVSVMRCALLWLKACRPGDCWLCGHIGSLHHCCAWSQHWPRERVTPYHGHVMRIVSVNSTSPC